MQANTSPWVPDFLMAYDLVHFQPVGCQLIHTLCYPYALPHVRRIFGDKLDHRADDFYQDGLLHMRRKIRDNQRLDHYLEWESFVPSWNTYFRHFLLNQRKSWNRRAERPGEVPEAINPHFYRVGIHDTDPFDGQHLELLLDHINRLLEAAPRRSSAPLETFLDHHLHGIPLKVLAAERGVPFNTLVVQHKRLREFLRKKLGEDFRNLFYGL